MKNTLTAALLLFAGAAFAQSNDTKKDTANYGYGERLYDARIGRYMSVDPNNKQTNPYQFADTAKTKQVANRTKKVVMRKK
jgi:RHS repeat-associated protein